MGFEMDDEQDEPFDLTPEERRDVEADLDDLAAMRTVFAPQGVKGVVIACQDCGSNHYFEWELLRDNLEQMLTTGEPRPDAVADAGLEPDRRIEVTQCPWCETPFDDSFAFCPKCGRTLATVRLYRELLDRGFDERDVRALLVRAGYEPF
jgi:hypothetical protein